MNNLVAHGEVGKALAAAPPSAKSAEGLMAPVAGESAGGLGVGVGSGISASKFITVPGNAGPKGNLIPLLIEESS